jgi:hypothetical protein
VLAHNRPDSRDCADAAQASLRSSMLRGWSRRGPGVSKVSIIMPPGTRTRVRDGGGPGLSALSHRPVQLRKSNIASVHPFGTGCAKRKRPETPLVMNRKIDRPSGALQAAGAARIGIGGGFAHAVRGFRGCSPCRTSLVIDGAPAPPALMAGDKSEAFSGIDWIVEITGFAGLAQR